MEHGGLDPDGAILTQHILWFDDLPCVGTQDMQDLLNPLIFVGSCESETGFEAVWSIGVDFEWWQMKFLHASYREMLYN